MKLLACLAVLSAIALPFMREPPAKPKNVGFPTPAKIKPVRVESLPLPQVPPPQIPGALQDGYYIIGTFANNGYVLTGIRASGGQGTVLPATTTIVQKVLLPGGFLVDQNVTQHGYVIVQGPTKAYPTAQDIPTQWPGGVSVMAWGQFEVLSGVTSSQAGQYWYPKWPVVGIAAP